MMYSRSSVIRIAILLFFVTAGLACGSSENKNKMEAEPPAPAQMSEPETKIPVQLNYADLMAAVTGDELPFSFEGSGDHTLIITRTEETMPGLTSILATIDNKEFGMASLILRDDRIRGSIQLYENSEVYQIRYEESSDSYVMVPRETTDQLDGSAPLVPPNKKG